jgi:hypothetical protein
MSLDITGMNAIRDKLLEHTLEPISSGQNRAKIILRNAADVAELAARILPSIHGAGMLLDDQNNRHALIELAVQTAVELRASALSSVLEAADSTDVDELLAAPPPQHSGMHGWDDDQEKGSRGSNTA